MALRCSAHTLGHCGPRPQVYTNIRQIRHTLGSVYHPRDYYIIHVDEDADVSLVRDVDDLIRWMPNVCLMQYDKQTRWSAAIGVGMPWPCRCLALCSLEADTRDGQHSASA